MSMKERKKMIGKIESWLENDPENAVEILAQIAMDEYSVFNLKLDIRKHELMKAYEMEEARS